MYLATNSCQHGVAVQCGLGVPRNLSTLSVRLPLPPAQASSSDAVCKNVSRLQHTYMKRASPEVAPYPFTTVTPNLGVTQIGGESESPAQRLVLADLPGLIEGAHQGRGLGRMFLRHLRRTRIILHVVDAATDDPAIDYWAVREELRMYNPEYCARPHVVALNKMDLQDAAQLQEEIASEVLTMAHRIQDESPEGNPKPTLPAAVVNVSAEAGTGLEELQAALQPLLQWQDADAAAAADSLTEEAWG